jgi:hypothetical protein
VEGLVVRRKTDDAAGELLAAYLRHVATRSTERRAAGEEIVIVLPEKADVIERRTNGGETEITLRIRTAT